jgi:hypothetical protein
MSQIYVRIMIQYCLEVLMSISFSAIADLCTFQPGMHVALGQELCGGAVAGRKGSLSF